jgi:anti-anti-sigma regulatory factor
VSQPPDPDTSAAIVLCDVRATPADLAAVHALVSLALTARRLGFKVQVSSPSRELAELLELCGLTEVLLSRPPSESERG